jgi:hypothetical protein
MGRDQPPGSDDQAERKKGDRDPPGCDVAALPPSADADQCERYEDDAGDDAERGDERVQIESLVVGWQEFWLSLSRS